MLTHDIRQAIRAWRRAPVVAVATILMIAIGVAANAAVFGVAQAVLFRPLPYPAADRLVEVFESSPAISEPLQTFRASPLNYLSWAERSRTLDALAAFQGTAFVVAGDGSSQAERVPGTAVTPSLFRVLGVEPVMGRELRPEDQVVGGPRVALVSQGFWQRRFGGDRSIVGKS